MKFTRAHTHNRRKYKKGEQFTGDVNTGRFLFHRGILEPDGSPMDKHVTAKRPNKQAWHSGDETQDAPKGEKAEE